MTLFRFRIVREGLTALKKVTVLVQPASRYRKTVLPQPNGGFFKETELRGSALIVHCEVLLVSKKISRSILKMLRPVDGLSCEMKKGAYLMASTKPTNRRLKDRMKF